MYAYYHVTSISNFNPVLYCNLHIFYILLHLFFLHTNTGVREIVPISGQYQSWDTTIYAYVFLMLSSLTFKIYEVTELRKAINTYYINPIDTDDWNTILSR